MSPCDHARDDVLVQGKPPAWVVVRSREERPGSALCPSGSLWDTAGHPQFHKLPPAWEAEPGGWIWRDPISLLPAGSLKPARLSRRQRSRDPQPGWARAQTRLKLQDVRNPPGICQHAPRANSQRR